MINMHIKISEIWDYFQKNKKHLEDNLDCIAEVIISKTNIPFVKVYLTNNKGYPSMTAENIEGDKETVFYEDCAISKDDCCKTYKQILTYLEYIDEGLKSRGFETKDEPKTKSTARPADGTDIEVVRSRENKLLTVVDKFITELMGLDEGDSVVTTNKELTAILDAIEILLFEAGFVIYRPRIVSINGTQCVIESPYEEDGLY